MSNVLDQNLLVASAATAPAEDCVAPSVTPSVELDALDPLPALHPILAPAMDLVVAAMPPPPSPEEAMPPETLPVGPAEDVETLYRTTRNLLFWVACRKFRIKEEEAESLIQEVFLSFLQSATKIDNSRAWLVAAMCNASRHYWRAMGRTHPLPECFGRGTDPKPLGLA